MTTVLLPVKYDLAKTMAVRESFARTLPEPPRLAVIVDDDPDIVGAVRDTWNPWEVIIELTALHGFWNALNAGLETLNVELREPIVYVGNDVVFDPMWLVEAEYCYREKMADGLGLLSLKDGIINGFTAPHGMTTRAWLNVINGSPFFEREFFHYYHDSEMSDRSKSLDRFFYCERSIVTHEHDPGVYYGTSGRDKAIKDRRDLEWLHGERERAFARMAA